MPQTEVDVLAPGYIAHAPGLPGSLDLEAWSQFTASFVEACPDLRLTVEDIFSREERVPGHHADRQGSGLLEHRDRPYGGRQGTGALVRDGPARSDAAARCHPRAGSVGRRLDS